jgi:hypothetical protein
MGIKQNKPKKLLLKEDFLGAIIEKVSHGYFPPPFNKTFQSFQKCRTVNS